MWSVMEKGLNYRNLHNKVSYVSDIHIYSNRCLLYCNLTVI